MSNNHMYIEIMLTPYLKHLITKIIDSVSVSNFRWKVLLVNDRPSS